MIHTFQKELFFSSKINLTFMKSLKLTCLLQNVSRNHQFGREGASEKQCVVIRSNSQKKSKLKIYNGSTFQGGNLCFFLNNKFCQERGGKAARAHCG